MISLSRKKKHEQPRKDMTQYTDRVEYQKMLFAAEDWAKQVSFVHAHSLNSMHYAEGRKDGSVMDIGYNSGVVKREIRSTGEVAGDVVISKLVVESGAIFNAKSSMKEDASNPSLKKITSSASPLSI